MSVITIPGGLCATLHPEYAGSSSSDSVKAHIRQAVKAMIEAAINDGLTPLTPPATTEPGLSFNITFPSRLDRVLRKHDIESGISSNDSDAAHCFLYAALARGDAATYRAETDASSINPYVAAAGHQPRQHQTVFYDCVIDTLGQQRIGLIEGATGLGKTLAIIASAVETLKAAGAGRLVIATPTIQLLRIFVQQHAKLENKVADFPVARTVLGRGEFISRADLEAVLHDGTVICDPAPILSWLAAGAPPQGEDAALELNYLRSSLLAISPGFPAEGVQLRPDSDEEEDPGLVAYQAQFDRDDTPVMEILYCTHAMLAVDIRLRMLAVGRSDEGDMLKADFNKAFSTQRQTYAALREGNDKAAVKAFGVQMVEESHNFTEQQAVIATTNDFGRLPPWQFLVIDEAHAFESNVANILTSNVSLTSFFRHLRTLKNTGELPASALRRADAALKRLHEIAPSHEDIDLTTSRQDALQAHAALQELAAAFCSTKKHKEGSKTYGKTRRLAQDIKRALQLATSSKGGMRIRLQYSPIRAFPQLTFGRESIAKELRFLWATAKACACVSATLYLRRLDKDSGSYMASLLNIPRERLKEYPPIRPQWIHTPVVGLWTPEKKELGTRFWLRPPTRKDKLNDKDRILREGEWLDEVAQSVIGIHSDAKGGTLVLMTSYDSAKGLAHRIGNAIHEKVVANPDIAIAEQLRHFVDFSLAGRRPIWIAIGGAWTGLDINGKSYGIEDPATDNLLTDLVIPRFPFSLNRTLTHNRRMEMGSTPWELLDTTMRFKQGLGRLIRREGLPANRRIFVLDGRIHDPSMVNYLSTLTRIMATYPAKVFEYAA